jgi:hypothetical protein
MTTRLIKGIINNGWSQSIIGGLIVAGVLVASPYVLVIEPIWFSIGCSFSAGLLFGG